MPASPTWRPMTADDVEAVIRLAAAIHQDHPEDDAVLTERFALMPEACLILEGSDGPIGYVLAHPCLFEKPPALNALMGTVPEGSDCLHLHDIALLPAARGTGAAGKAVEHVAKVGKAHGLAHVSIVSVNGTEPFWEKQGFRLHTSPALEQKLASYEGSSSYMLRDLR
ncbi:GNAT family N-acetyltransferase [Kordiimonas marina]|uniref:GNAT family N-acetyltransferase n=1 Tax=Kordiimonas marina TaxID=2872312 RepID=UPI001FF1591A|nr:GNAT family N-acetyltransferase [Kordiimonas marina]MCJ9429151.1 GNAT family N-acetyltransferase [Kordiimonas marina]